jgi:aspartate aminotransferase-like enzyme
MKDYGVALAQRRTCSSNLDGNGGSTMRDENINMSAGQTALSPRCRENLANQLDTPIYFPPYWQLEIATVDLLQKLMNTGNSMMLVNGSATYGIEAGLRSFLEHGDRLLVASSGPFGKLMSELGQMARADVTTIEAPFGEAVNPEDIQNVLKKERPFKAVALVHVETTTGVINPVREVSDLARRHGAMMFLDSVSAIGGTPVDVDNWGIDVCFATAQKCLNGPQGVAIVCVGQRAWEAYEARKHSVEGLCLDLGVWRDYHEKVEEDLAHWFDRKPVAIRQPKKAKAVHGPSPSYSLTLGLQGALKDFFERDPAVTYQKHLKAAQAVRNAVRSMGLKVLAREAVASPVTTTVVLPDQINQLTLRKHIYENYGIALAVGSKLNMNCIRIATMGLGTDPQQVLRTISSFEAALVDLGYGGFTPNEGYLAAKSILGQ